MDFYRQNSGVGIPDRLMCPWRDDVAPYAQKMREFSERFANEIMGKPEERGLYLCGKAGIGKSRIAALMAELVYQKGFSVRWYGCAKLYARLRETMSPGTGETELDVLREMQVPDLLILDDLGSERASEWTLERAYLILNERYENRKKILVTTNFNLAELRAYWSKNQECAYAAERLVSRLGGMCREVSNFGSSDLRKVA